MRFVPISALGSLVIWTTSVAAQNPRPVSAAVVTTSTSITTTTSSRTSSISIAPSPTNSGSCTLHIDHWHCSGEGESSSVSDGGSEEYGQTLSNGCVQHGTHWHCPAGVAAPCEALLGDYDMGLHVAAIFVLLVASGTGSWLPVILGARAGRSALFNNVFFVFKHFGGGVIISTAFIHLLMHAFVMFANNCLGTLSYEAIAPAIAMASLIIVWAIDFTAARVLAKKRVPDSPEMDAGDDKAQGKLFSTGHDHDFSNVSRSDVMAAPDSRRAEWEVQLLEAGICFHSIMIGVTLGAQGGSSFIPTFCAIVFHQLFEGLGLGARIARLKTQKYKKFLSCAAYTVITPLGIVIGVAVRNSFNLSGKATLLSIGILDSISAGILLYAGIAQLLVGDWLAGEMRTASLGRVLLGGFSLVLGLFAMSLIGKWA